MRLFYFSLYIYIIMHWINRQLALIYVFKLLSGCELDEIRRHSVCQLLTFLTQHKTVRTDARKNKVPVNKTAPSVWWSKRRETRDWPESEFERWSFPDTITLSLKNINIVLLLILLLIKESPKGFFDFLRKKWKQKLFIN